MESVGARPKRRTRKAISSEEDEEEEAAAAVDQGDSSEDFTGKGGKAKAKAKLKAKGKAPAKKVLAPSSKRNATRKSKFDESEEEEDSQADELGDEDIRDALTRRSVVDKENKPTALQRRKKQEEEERRSESDYSSAADNVKTATATAASAVKAERQSSANPRDSTAHDAEVKASALFDTPSTSETIPQGPQARLVIHKIVLVNFKSYYGRQVIGPFHKSFSSVVGPNGSGKSNTIDALLFVFGFKATKMRQGKLSELIHNSEGKENLLECSVEVWFREIIDTPQSEDFEVVPDSQLVVSRTAYRDNKSKYTINQRSSTFAEVQTLLKGRGIDLDHKRFLILQGEVESIAQMKPKGATEHEEGLLEYLEDIIGTSKYKKDIEDALVKVDEFGEQRSERLNRLRLVEKEKDTLEHKKKEAEGFLRDSNALTIAQSHLWQSYMDTCKKNIVIGNQAMEESQEELQVEEQKVSVFKKEHKDLLAAFEELTAEYETMEATTKEVTKRLTIYEREEVQLQEKRKNLVTKQKKLDKQLTEDKHSRNSAQATITSCTDSLRKNRAELESVEANLEREEAVLESIVESLKGKTQQYSDAIEKKQTALAPWSAKLRDKQARAAVCQSELNLIREKSSVDAEALAEAEKLAKQDLESMADCNKTVKRCVGERQDLVTRIENLKDNIEVLENRKIDAEQRLRASKNKLDEAKASINANRGESAVLSHLTKLKDLGKLKGFVGRLGSLGTIGDKYDVAISTAGSALNNLVVETVETAQECIEILRKGGVGRATFLVLSQMPNQDFSKLQTPENVPRLFDLIKLKDVRFGPMFYKVLRNTLVASDLEQANRIAFGQKERWRVVTLDGNLVESSGAMTGGGNKVARGIMSSKFANASVSPDNLAKFEEESIKLQAECEQASTRCSEANQELQKTQKLLPGLEMAIKKAEMNLRSEEKKMIETERRLKELRQQSLPDAAEERKAASLSKEIATLNLEAETFSKEFERISEEIRDLQEKILEVGGLKLRTQKSKVDGMKTMSQLASDAITKAEVTLAKSEKDLKATERTTADAKIKLEAIQEELGELQASIDSKAETLQEVKNNVDAVRSVMNDKKEERAGVKELLDERSEHLSNFRVIEVELKHSIEEAKRVIKTAEAQMSGYQEKFSRLALEDIGDSDNEDDEDYEGPEKAESRGPDGSIPILTEEQLQSVNKERLNATIAELEERLQRSTANMAVLQEYRRREAEYLSRAKDLEEITNARDLAKADYDSLRKRRLDEFMAGFTTITAKLKEMYQMITLGGNAELELVDSMDPFSEGIIFSVMPPKKSWKNISNLSGGEKTLSSLALVFALHVFKPTPLYFMDEIDAALDFRNVSIVANYIKDRTKNAQFIIISLRNDMFELSNQLVGIYKTGNCTKSISIQNGELGA